MHLQKHMIFKVLKFLGFFFFARLYQVLFHIAFSFRTQYFQRYLDEITMCEHVPVHGLVYVKEKIGPCDLTLVKIPGVLKQSRNRSIASLTSLQWIYWFYSSVELLL